jgi:hypothetical protein
MPIRARTTFLHESDLIDPDLDCTRVPTKFPRLPDPLTALDKNIQALFVSIWMAKTICDIWEVVGKVLFQYGKEQKFFNFRTIRCRLFHQLEKIKSGWRRLESILSQKWWAVHMNTCARSSRMHSWFTAGKTKLQTIMRDMAGVIKLRAGVKQPDVMVPDHFRPCGECNLAPYESIGQQFPQFLVVSSGDTFCIVCAERIPWEVVTWFVLLVLRFMIVLLTPTRVDLGGISLERA